MTSTFYLLDINQLSPGDIVLTSQDTKISKGIRRITGGEFSHAILIAGHGTYIHSDRSGVHSGNLQRLLLKKKSDALCLRLKNSTAPDSIQRICDFARSQIGKQYSVPQAIASTTKRSKSVDLKSNRQFCSRLVAQAYAYAGIDLVPTADYCFPIELFNKQLMVEVPDTVRIASAEELQFASSPSPLEIQTRITNRIYEQARDVARVDIQNEGQLIMVLQKRPELDIAFSDILEKSGYLTMWKMEVERNPWRYSKDHLDRVEMSDEGLASELTSATELVTRFQSQLVAFKALRAKQPLKYFHLCADLYQTLVTLQAMRKSFLEERIESKKAK